MLDKTNSDVHLDSSPKPLATASSPRRTLSAGSAPEDVRPQLPAGDAPPCDVLECRPPFRLQPYPPSQPVGDGLLADADASMTAAAQEVRDSASQSGLTSDDEDRLSQRLNVIPITSRPSHVGGVYTRPLVRVNALNSSNFPRKSDTVLSDMNAARSQNISPAGRCRTLAERLKFLMERRNWTAADVRHRCNELAGREVVTQQALSWILTHNAATSELAPIFAEVFEVRGMWLQWGFGPMKDKRIKRYKAIARHFRKKSSPDDSDS